MNRYRIIDIDSALLLEWLKSREYDVPTRIVSEIPNDAVIVRIMVNDKMGWPVVSLLVSSAEFDDVVPREQIPRWFPNFTVYRDYA